MKKHSLAIVALGASCYAASLVQSCFDGTVFRCLVLGAVSGLVGYGVGWRWGSR